jgi:hypothetical protein
MADALKQAVPVPRLQRITEVLMRHGHYVDPEGPEGDESVIHWMRADAERVLAGPLTYAGIDEALIDTGVHDPTGCNDLCVRDLMETLGV